MIEFKRDYGEQFAKRLEIEFATKITSELRGLLNAFDEEMQRAFGGAVHVVLTCLVRTPEENALDNGRPMSSHLRGDAADIRTAIWTGNQINYALAWLSSTYGDRVCAVYHNAGSGHHLHVNVNWGWSCHNDASHPFEPLQPNGGNDGSECNTRQRRDICGFEN